MNQRTASRLGSQRVDCRTILETFERACRCEPLRPGTGRGPVQWFKAPMRVQSWRSKLPRNFQLLGDERRRADKCYAAGTKVNEQCHAWRIHEFHVGKVKPQQPAFGQHPLTGDVQLRDPRADDSALEAEVTAWLARPIFEILSIGGLEAEGARMSGLRLAVHPAAKLFAQLPAPDARTADFDDSK